MRKCQCKEFQESASQIIDQQLFCSGQAAAPKYSGPGFLYCPWCRGLVTNLMKDGAVAEAGERKVYVVIVNDRHADSDARVYADKVDAQAYAIDKAREYATFDSDVKARDFGKDQGWVLCVEYSPEGDHVIVIERNLIDAAS